MFDNIGPVSQYTVSTMVCCFFRSCYNNGSNYANSLAHADILCRFYSLHQCLLDIYIYNNLGSNICKRDRAVVMVKLLLLSYFFDSFYLYNDIYRNSFRSSHLFCSIIFTSLSYVLDFSEQVVVLFHLHGNFRRFLGVLGGVQENFGYSKSSKVDGWFK